MQGLEVKTTFRKANILLRGIWLVAGLGNQPDFHALSQRFMPHANSRHCACIGCRLVAQATNFSRPASRLRLRRHFVRFAADDGFDVTFDDAAGDFHRQDAIIARHVIHDIEHQLFEDAAQGARAGAFFDGLGG